MAVKKAAAKRSTRKRPARKTAARKSAAKRTAKKRARSPSGPPRSGNCREADRQEEGHEEAGNREAGRQEAGHKEAGREAGRQEEGHEEAGTCKAGHQEEGHKEEGHEEAGTCKAGHQEEGHEEAGNCQAGHQEAGPGPQGSCPEDDGPEASACPEGALTRPGAAGLPVAECEVGVLRGPCCASGPSSGRGRCSSVPSSTQGRIRWKASPEGRPASDPWVASCRRTLDRRSRPRAVAPSAGAMPKVLSAWLPWQSSAAIFDLLETGTCSPGGLAGRPPIGEGLAVGAEPGPVRGRSGGRGRRPGRRW